MKVTNIKSIGKYEYDGYLLREIKTGKVDGDYVIFYLERNKRVFISIAEFLDDRWKKY